jgi:hypothetical protein
VVRQNIRDAYAGGMIDRTDYTQLMATLKDSANYDRIKRSPEIDELRTNIARSFIYQITGTDVEDPLNIDKFIGGVTPADVSPQAYGAMQMLLLEFDEKFQTFYEGEQYTAAIEAGDSKEMMKLERTFLREMTNKYLLNADEEPLVMKAVRPYIPKENS